MPAASSAARVCHSSCVKSQMINNAISQNQESPEWAKKAAYLNQVLSLGSKRKRWDQRKSVSRMDFIVMGLIQYQISNEYTLNHEA